MKLVDKNGILFNKHICFIMVEVLEVLKSPSYLQYLYHGNAYMLLEEIILH